MWKRIIPKVSDPVRMDEALQLAGNHSLKLLPYEECREGSLREMLRKHHTAGETETHDSGIAVFIGPEGGFDSSEAESYGFRLYTRHAGTKDPEDRDCRCCGHSDDYV